MHTPILKFTTTMYLILTSFIIIFWQPLAIADMTIKIEEGIPGAIPIAIIPFDWDQDDAELSHNLETVITTDLTRTGRFIALDEQDMLNQPHNSSEIDYKEWRVLGQDALTIGKVTRRGKNYNIQFQLFDIPNKTQLAAYQLTTPREGIRATAHQIADIVYEKLTGTQGAFSTRIAYITQKNPINAPPQIQIKISDADGFNSQTIVESNEPLMSPAWSKDGNRIAYVSFENKQQAIFVQDLHTGTRKQVAAHAGINSAPDWSPDGHKLALVLSKDGDPEIYTLTLANKKLTRITNNVAIDTEPTWSPNGRFIAFTSDRSGSPQIYQVSIDGTGLKRLTFTGDYNAAPTYSPNGKFLSLVTRNQGNFKISLLTLTNNTIKDLTTGPLDESPHFTSNGGLIVYASKRHERGELSSISIDGRIQQIFMSSEDELREPTCSPLN